ncbi:myo-inositol-1-monophosphatase [Polychaeton citri CBS 116435]|uniref:Myo-inositol-1-monophosphatase n=1 Tax=Polychaeton citri CBS 116435 TaxID=1314669 RepID=A0A9P4QA38_9PEZI|nr:myo-inositol-1-monophosphatase [Polychaeton citri CBS 116435]
MDSQFAGELHIASTAIQHCALLTKSLQKATLSSSDSISKSDFSPVTIGDFAVQALLTSALHAAFPGDAFLAEESADDLRSNESLCKHVWELVEKAKPWFASSSPALKVPESETELLDLIDLGGKNDRSNDGRTWIFDPIDGTATFMRGQQYAINCALLVDGREELGLIGCPNLRPETTRVSEDDIDAAGLGCIVFAAKGHGTWVRPMQQGAELLPPQAVPRHGDEATINALGWSDCATYPSTILHLHQQVAAKLGTSWPGTDLFSSLMKYAALGLGKTSICIRIFKFRSWRSNVWDHAGGILIFTEAGGKVTDLDGNDIDFTKGRKMTENCGLVCAPGSVHSEILALIKEVIDGYGEIPWSK